jgi:hypothetical protein
VATFHFKVCLLPKCNFKNILMPGDLAMSQILESDDSSLKSSLDPSASNVVEIPENQPTEDSADYEADPADPDTIDPELINTPGLNPDADEDEDAEDEVDPELDPELPDPITPDVDLPEPDEVIREEIDSGVRDPQRISNPDAGI